MRRIIAILTVISFVICLAGCHSTSLSNTIQTNEQEVTIYVPENTHCELSGSLWSKDLIYGSGNQSGFYSLERTDRYANVVYTDYQTNNQVVLCSRPECKHDNDSCMGFESEGANSPSILALDDIIVFVYPGNPYYYEELGKSVLPRIDVTDLNGANRRTIVTFESDIKIDLNNIAYDNDNIYLLQEVIQIEGDNIWRGLQFQQINLSSGAIKRIAEFTDLDKQSIFFLGASKSKFVFKRIANGVMDESLEGREQWDNFVSGQVHEIFTINAQSELSDALITYPQGVYSSYVLNGKIVLMAMDTSIIMIDPETGEANTIIDEVPYKNTLLYGLPKAILDEWLIIDLVPVEDEPETRYAVNLQTYELRELTLAFQYDGLSQLYVIYAQVNSNALVCVDRKMEYINATMADGTVVTNPKFVDYWALIGIDDLISNNNTYTPVQKLAA